MIHINVTQSKIYISGRCGPFSVFSEKKILSKTDRDKQTFGQIIFIYRMWQTDKQTDIKTNNFYIYDVHMKTNWFSNY